MRSVFLGFFVALIMIGGASAETIIYENITVGQYKSIQIKDTTNLKYVNTYAYDVYLNDSFYGTFQKNEIILVPDNVSIRILPTNEVKNTLNSNAFMSMIGVGFYSFMQYGIYLIILFFLIIYFIRRLRR